MSRGSPRRSFSPVRTMAQQFSDRRRSNTYIPHQYDRPYTPNDVRPAGPLRSSWEEKERMMIPRAHSPTEPNRTRLSGLNDSTFDDRSYRPVGHFQDTSLPHYRERPPSPAPLTTFRDRPVTYFRDRTVTPTAVAPGGPTSFQDNPKAPYIPEERLQGNNRWVSGASPGASSWDPRNPRPDQRGWLPRPNVAPHFPFPRLHAPAGQRSFLEPSPAWKRAREDRDRQTRIDHRTSIPTDHRISPSGNYNLDGLRDPSTSATAPTNVVQRSNDVQDFQTRRFRQPPPPNVLPSQMEQRARFPDRMGAPERRPQDNGWRGPNFSTPRRPLHRISARISARPKRSPSPTSASSDSSGSGVTRSRRKSRSESRSTRSRLSSVERESCRDVGSFAGGRRSSPSHRRPPAPTTRGVTSNPSYSTLGRPHTFPIHSRPNPRSAAALLPTASSILPASFVLPYGTTRQPNKEKVPSRPPSASSQLSRSSIRSSVHSSPGMTTTEVPPDPLANHTVFSALPPSEVANPMPTFDIPPPSGPAPSDDLEFELPGMRFQKDGALKPGLPPPPPNSGLEIIIDLTHLESPTPDDNVPAIATDSGSFKEVDPRVESITPDIRERSMTRDFTSVDQANSMLSPFSVREDSFMVGKITCLSPPMAQTSQSKVAISDKRISSHLIIPTSEEQDISRADEASATVERLDTAPEDKIEADSIGPESSPLSEPMPLSPALGLPGLQEEVDEDRSSMNIDEESTSEAADDIAAALRVFAKAREGKDLQTRNERYEPILRANHALLDAPCTRMNTSNDDLVREVMEDSFQARLETHSAVSQSLLIHFMKRSEDLAAKTRRLRAEYKAYHDRWVTNCRKLDQSMASSASQGLDGLPPPSGRVTRRSTNYGDAVRSDLEMEQIIASLGNEDLTDPNVLAIRNTAVIPDLITTDPSMIDILYKDDNGLVDDPGDMFNIYDALGRWTDEEKEIYLQKYGVYPKQFGTIASFLPGKTAGQCIMFYYLHKKELIDFRAAIAKYGKRKRRGGRKAGKGKGNALLADIVKPPRLQNDEDGLHKHNDRYHAIVPVDGRHIPSRRQIQLLQNAQERASCVVSETAVTQGNREAALQQEDDNVGSDADSGRSNRQRSSQRMHGKGGRLSPSENEDETGTVVVATPDRKRQARFIASQDIAREPEAAQDSAKKAKPSEKGKEKEKRPPGRPPKKSRERAKLGDKGGGSLPHKIATSYVWSKGEEANYLKLLSRHGTDFEKIAAEMPAKTATQCRNYFNNHVKGSDREHATKERGTPITAPESVRSKPALESHLKDQATKRSKSKDAMNGDSDVGSAVSRGQRSRQVGSSHGSKGKEKNPASSSDRASAAPNVASTPSESRVSSSSTNDVPKRLPNFTKSKRLDSSLRG